MTQSQFELKCNSSRLLNKPALSALSLDCIDTPSADNEKQWDDRSHLAEAASLEMRE